MFTRYRENKEEGRLRKRVSGAGIGMNRCHVEMTSEDGTGVDSPHGGNWMVFGGKAQEAERRLPCGFS